jgi:hypothetical protein
MNDLATVLDIVTSNASAAIDQRDAYRDSIASYAQNVCDTLSEQGLQEYERAALTRYYILIGKALDPMQAISKGGK